jgi:hypothetical protein
MIKKSTRAVALIGAVGMLTLGTAAIAAADTPNPVGANGCNGNIVATTNHNSGTNDNNSTGPGYFFHDGQTTKTAIEGVRAAAGC